VPYGSLEDLEKLQEELAFEIAIEGRRISPDWYVEERILLGFVQAVNISINDLAKAIDSVFVKHATKLFEAKRYRPCSALVLRGLEFLSKFSDTLSHVEKVVNGVQSRSRIKALPWPAFDFDGRHKLVEDSRQTLLALLGKLLTPLALTPDDVSLPDYFGACYVHVLEETFAVLIKDEEVFFTKWFPISFLGGLAAYDKLNEHLIDWHQETAIILRADVLIDILDMGSYAFFLSQYRGKDHYWETCLASWDKFLKTKENPHEFANFMVNLVNFRSSRMSMTPSRSNRFKWEQALMSYLRHEDALVDMVYMPGRTMKPHSHPSRLVRDICTTGGMGIHWPGPEIFLIAYFERHRKLGPLADLRDTHRLRRALQEGDTQDERLEDSSEE
jgi:hypothetical protein